MTTSATTDRAENHASPAGQARLGDGQRDAERQASAIAPAPPSTGVRVRRFRTAGGRPRTGQAQLGRAHRRAVCAASGFVGGAEAVALVSFGRETPFATTPSTGARGRGPAAARAGARRVAGVPDTGDDDDPVDEPSSGTASLTSSGGGASTSTWSNSSATERSTSRIARRQAAPAGWRRVAADEQHRTGRAIERRCDAPPRAGSRGESLCRDETLPRPRRRNEILRHPRAGGPCPAPGAVAAAAPVCRASRSAVPRRARVRRRAHRSARRALTPSSPATPAADSASISATRAPASRCTSARLAAGSTCRRRRRR